MEMDYLYRHVIPEKCSIKVQPLNKLTVTLWKKKPGEQWFGVCTSKDWLQFKINAKALSLLGSRSPSPSRRNISVLSKALSHPLFMGSLFIYGSIKIYVESYLRLKGGLSSESELLFLVIPLQVVMMAAFLPVGVYMNHHVSVKMWVLT